VWVPHATAVLAVIETGSGSDTNLLALLRELLPADGRWRHRHGSPGHGRDHLLPALLPPYASVPVLGGQLALGTWQSICLVDTNGNNPIRTVRLSFLPGLFLTRAELRDVGAPAVWSACRGALLVQQPHPKGTPRGTVVAHCRSGLCSGLRWGSIMAGGRNSTRLPRMVISHPMACTHLWWVGQIRHILFISVRPP